MNGMDQEMQAGRDALKDLRSSRRMAIEEASQRMKRLKRNMDSVREALQEGPATVPELSEATGIPTEETLWIVASLKKFGEVTEAEKDGSYFRYKRMTNEE